MHLELGISFSIFFLADWMVRPDRKRILNAFLRFVRSFCEMLALSRPTELRP